MNDSSKTQRQKNSLSIQTNPPSVNPHKLTELIEKAGPTMTTCLGPKEVAIMMENVQEDSRRYQAEQSVSVAAILNKVVGSEQY